MDLIVEREDVWAAGMDDKPGALATKLEILAEAGADLDFIIARRAPDKPGTGVVFVTPLRGDAEIDAATEIGFSVTSHMHAVRVEGENEKGIAAKITAKLAKARINLSGFSGAVIGRKFVLHLAFRTEEAAAKAVKTLKKA
jgi:hypothetical protein